MAVAIQPQLAFIPVAKIKVADNVRANLGDLDDLTLSIQTFGVLQPLAVRPENGQWIVIAGHRRLAAATAAGLKEVPCLVREDLTDAPALIAQLIENLQRVDLDPLEEAKGYKDLLGHDLKQKEIAEKVGRSEAHISKRLALLDLPQEAHELLRKGKVQLVDLVELVPYAKEPQVITETIKSIEDSVKKGWHFDVGRQAESVKARLDQQRAKDAALEQLKKAKVSILKTDQYGYLVGDRRNVIRLGKGHGELDLATEVHAKEACHAAYIDTYGQVRYVCTKLGNHSRSKDPEIAKAVKKLRAGRTGAISGSRQPKEDPKVLARKAALAERTAARLPFLKKLITARQKREAVLDFTLRQLIQLALDGGDGFEEIAGAVLGMNLPPKKHKYERVMPDFATYVSSGKDRVFSLAYALALASGEEGLRGEGFGAGVSDPAAVRLVAHLKATGYRPDKVELSEEGSSRGRAMPAWDVKKAAKKK